MNEATFEATLNGVLNRLFVGAIRPKIQHQTILTLRLGHHKIVVDGKAKSKVQGRLDVLLSFGDTHLAVLELKRPGLALTEGDEDQAWSYARLLHPMPPFYIVSNGDDTRLFKSYDRSRVEGSTLDEQAIVGQFSAAAAAAAGSEKVAIHCLLGRSPEAFRSVFHAISHKQLRFLMGAVDNLNRPICVELGIVRDVTLGLFHTLAKNPPPVITLFGDALSGKTNVAADLCRLRDARPTPCSFAPVYVNCEYLEHGLLQTLANEVSVETNVSASVDDVRHWLRSRTLANSEARPVILVDSYSPDMSDQLRAEISELLDLAGPESFSIVVIVDSAHTDQLLRTIKRGQPTKLGSMSVLVQVPRMLNDAEVTRAAEQVYARNRLMPELGAQHNPMYRLPSTWRMLASLDEQKGGLLPASLGAEQLHNIEISHPLPAEQLEDVRNLVQGLLKDRTPRLRGLLLSSPGWISLQAAREAIGEEGLDRLRNSGFVRVRITHERHSVVTPQIPPLLAAYAVRIVQDRLEELIEPSVESAVDVFLADCQRLPYGELVAAAAILTDGLTQKSCDAVVSRLLDMEPTISGISADAKLAVLFEGRDPVDLSADLIKAAIEEGGGYMYGDVFPYLIVSHVLRWSAVQDGKVPEWAIRAIERVASVRIPLYAADFASKERLRHATPVTSFDLRGGGSVLSGCNGVIEPITDVLRHIALNATDDFSKLVHRLLTDETPSFALLNRTWLAAEFVSRLQTPVAGDARSWAEALDKKIQARCPDELGHSAMTDDE